ncbi:MAG TPA: hypothetical protein VMJ10_02905 [Kofleriaceae bacterium]|nr:hypothetical protein [Kofleriaceae bacterium]
MVRTAVVVCALAACSGSGAKDTTDIKPTLDLASTSTADIMHLIGDAGGADISDAESYVDAFSAGSDPCPAATVSGTTITFTGNGCTTQASIKITGSATVENPMLDSRVAFDPSKPTAYTFDQLSLAADVPVMYDGTLTYTNEFKDYVADVTATTAGSTFRSNLFYTCGTTQGGCTLANSGIEIVGTGGVLASGTVTSTQEMYTLRGTDTLTATVTEGATPCTTWQISDGSSGPSCP